MMAPPASKQPSRDEVIAREKRRTAAIRMQLTVNHPFWGYLLIETELIPAVELPSLAATDCERRIWYNPTLTQYLTLDELGFVMAHEVGHILTDKGSAYGTIADQTSGYPQRGGHFGRPATPPDNRYLHFYNLMGGSRYRLWDVDVTEAPPAAPEVRTFNQYRDVRASPYLR